MKKNLLLCLGFAVLAVFGANAAEPTMNWAKLIESESGQVTPEDMIESGDKVYTAARFQSKSNADLLGVCFGDALDVAIGAQNNGKSGNYNLLLAQTDRAGAPQWYAYTNYGDVYSASLGATSDGGIVATLMVRHTNKNEDGSNRVLSVVDAKGTTTAMELTYTAWTYHIAVLKFASDGALEWNKLIPVGDGSNDLKAWTAIDASDNVYIGGCHVLPFSVDGVEIASPKDENSLYLVKLTSTGDFVKQFAITGTTVTDYLDALTIADETVYATGRIKGDGTNSAYFGNFEITPTTYDDVYVAAFTTDLEPKWASVVYATPWVAPSDGKKTHTTQIKGIDVSDGRVLVSGLVKGGFSTANDTDADGVSASELIHTSSASLEGYVLEFSATDGSFEKAMIHGTGISGYFAATVSDNDIYACGYSYASGEGGVLVKFDENGNKQSSWNLVTSSGMMTGFSSSFSGKTLYASYRNRNADFNFIGSDYVIPATDDWSGVVASFNVADIESGIVALPDVNGATVCGMDGAIRIVSEKAETFSVYDIAGRLVKSVVVEGEAAIAMPAGFYVVNGEKVIVR